MNIFILSSDPIKAAQMQCDKHVVKMILESTQMLSTAMNVTGNGLGPYKSTHVNHPCSKWVRESKQNFDWLLQHAVALLIEYTFRYGKVHACTDKILSIIAQDIQLPDKGLTPFAQAMPDTYRTADAVAAYRAYYINEKRAIAEWNKTRSAPDWWV